MTCRDMPEGSLGKVEDGGLPPAGSGVVLFRLEVFRVEGLKRLFRSFLLKILFRASLRSILHWSLRKVRTHTLSRIQRKRERERERERESESESERERERGGKRRNHRVLTNKRAQETARFEPKARIPAILHTGLIDHKSHHICRFRRRCVWDCNLRGMVEAALRL